MALLKNNWPLAALLLSAAMLATAHVFQLNGYAPCSLCLRQREVYWAIIPVCIVALVLPRVWKSPSLPRAMNLLIGGAFLAGAGVAAYHAGVEWKFWPGPSTCGGLSGGGVSANDIAGALGGKAIHVVPCDEAAWRDPVLQISMAGWNALASLAFAGFSFFAAAAPIGRPTED